MGWEEWRAGAEHIESGGLAVATYDRGAPDATPLTFLHGYPSASLDIAPVAHLLGGDWRVLAIDMPGFGASEKRPGLPLSIDAAADAVEAMWAARAVTSTLLVAHDYSVSVTQELLARRAERDLGVAVGGVVWMNGGLDPDLHRPTFGQQMLLDPDHGAEVAAAVTEETFLDAIRATWGTRVEMVDDEVREIYRSMDDGGGVALMGELLHYIADRREHAERWRAALGTSDLPTTFVWGELDPVSGAHMIDGVEPVLGGTPRIVRLPDVGHWPLLEAPDVVAAEIRALAG
ncbi:alpha/beta hydrolase [Iamia sp.]|uniref:alpha/beta fold hydrolase n=1 Tax=Iamia sp. TaxID=2722710 RepID=UPI002C0E541B|nr:alpha/beta hydrolase [Iamia sp.]HXH57486.1 alpha/beta hydrolase [Iamia sp.]